ncbi:hypothetical protein RJ639_028308 [Escallonia herrerae]|uniref:Uncharacterized protein n=1 Tax=Escallonia herrerae TaxID=1293975 RepID=A0AA89BP25_9ASTE|nr:hypothetical protein RJ639_028308 [Escallonia herrerae]
MHANRILDLEIIGFVEDIPGANRGDGGGGSARWMCCKMEAMEATGCEIYDPKPQIANNIDTTFTPSILSWKNTTARLGTIGKPKVLITLENKEDTLKISPTQPIEKTCHAMAIHTNVITYDTFPSSKTSISFL